ncbi:MAG TPA: pyridoxal 5'-phosphate synthase glutaminase subunit PdxT [Vicinamibacteria bacterium]|nr:pyridoxal 5'-phosphate synthase glutaminase subunit PdxT [Vicinamibacteria bacterium]
MEVGVLALQGDFAAHVEVLRALGATVREVRHPQGLAGLAGLVLPGGESTALLRLMDGARWPEAIGALQAGGGALLGTCAGAILLARSVAPPQACLGLLDAEVVRNAYGRQVDSFEAPVDAPAPYGPLRGTFIRAPRFRAVGPQVEVAGTLRGEPVLVRQGRVLAATFHPELEGANGVHRAFLTLAAGGTVAAEEGPGGSEYEISADPTRLDLDVIHGFLTASYWARGIPRDVVERSLRHSLCFGVYHHDRQVGLARVVSDRATYAYLADVFVLEAHRGRGLAQRLLARIKSHPDLQGLRRWSLGTRDAHGLYRRFGFREPADPSLWMEIHDPGLYSPRSPRA